jgi:membrane-associated PAP2 superfamily phosphatase
MMIDDFLGGAISMGFAIAALLFLKYWKRTRDGFFLAFAAAFLLLGINQALLSVTNVPVEERSSLYLIRLAAFLIIIGAMWSKNREARRGGD